MSDLTLDGDPDLGTRSGAAGVQIADKLRKAILDGEHLPGARIRQEDLADRHSASRSPVREALKILEAEGLVELIPNRGAWVARLSAEECDELYRIRERIEPLLLRLSLESLSDDTVDELELLADSLQRSTDVEQFLRLDREFHLVSYAARTHVLGDLVAQLWNRTQYYRRLYTRLFRSEGDMSVHYEHHLLVSAIRARDADEAERVLLGHIRRTRLELARHPQLFSPFHERHEEHES